MVVSPLRCTLDFCFAPAAMIVRFDKKQIKHNWPTCPLCGQGQLVPLGQGVHLRIRNDFVAAVRTDTTVSSSSLTPAGHSKTKVHHSDRQAETLSMDHTYGILSPSSCSACHRVPQATRLIEWHRDNVTMPMLAGAQRLRQLASAGASPEAELRAIEAADDGEP